MDNKTVSTVAINEAVDYINSQFMSKLDDDTAKILEQFNDLKAKEILTSANIDSLVAEIKGKINGLQNSFDNVAATIRQNMAASEEAIAANRSAVEGHLQ